jgi:hypothetical protein
MDEAFFRDSMKSASIYMYRQGCKSTGLCNSVSTEIINRFRTFKTALKEEHRLRVFGNKGAEENICQSQSHIATDGQSVSLGVVPHCLTFTVLFFWGALSRERTGLSFVHAAGPCQRSLSQVRVP